MKIYFILAIVLTGLGIYVISLALKAWRGIKIKNGFSGMVLLLMPHSLGIVRYRGDAWYFILTLGLTIIGIFLFSSDMPRVVEKGNS